MASNTSIYRPFIGREARFIRLRPDAWTEPISCDLVYHSMNDPPAYIALSYAWGDLNDTKAILVEDHSVQVTTNLFAALRQMRAFLVDHSKAPEVFKKEDILLWIDALCINQVDLIRKSVQVPRMAKIFGGAALVLAWLGENKEFDRAVRKIMDVATHFENFEKTSVDMLETEFLDPLQQYKTVAFCRTFHNMLERPWFHRVWVIQEVALAREKPVLMAGAHWCELQSLNNLWRQFSYSAKYFYVERLLETGWTGLELNFYEVFRRNVTEAWAIIAAPFRDKIDVLEQHLDDLQSVAKEFGPRVKHEVLSLEYAIAWNKSMAPGTKDAAKIHTFMWLLIQILERMPRLINATIPHDYIYGVLSMTMFSSVPKSLEPDYTAPFSKVFHIYAKALLECTGDISIICRRGHNLVDVPSWVPDFRYVRADNQRGETFQPMPGNDTDVQISRAGDVCSVVGVHLGSVIITYFCPSISQVANDKDHRALQYIRSFDAFLEHACTSVQVSKELVLEAFLITFFDPARAGIVRMQRFREIYRSAVDRLPLAGGSYHRMYDQEVVGIFEAMIPGHYMFLTSRGVIGRLVSDTQRVAKDDVLAMIKSAYDPFLLRPTSTTQEYTFIGGCRVFHEGDGKIGRTREYYDENETEKFRLV